MKKKLSKDYLKISERVHLPIREIKFQAIQSTGPGGQHVNKTSSAIHLIFDIQKSSLPETYKTRLLKLNDSRVTKKGFIIIKAKRYKEQDRNKEDSLKRLSIIIMSVFKLEKKRKITSPKIGVKRRRSEEKKKKSFVKNLRKKIYV